MQCVCIGICFWWIVLTCMITVYGAVEDCDMSNRVDAVMAEQECPESVELNNPEIVLIDTPITYEDVVYVTPITETEANEQLKTIEECLSVLDNECKNGDYTYDAFVCMQSEIQRLTSAYNQLNTDLENFARWKEEHYYAAMTWMFLRQNGCSEASAAGIIGNMMAETSGGSLNLKPEIFSSGRYYYGLCQWSLGNRPHIAGISFEEQLDYLLKTMPSEFGYYAYIYKKGFSYEKFLAMDDPEAAAIAFAKIYERCGSGSYSARERYAMKAYNYFTGD